MERPPLSPAGPRRFASILRILDQIQLLDACRYLRGQLTHDVTILMFHYVGPSPKYLIESVDTTAFTKQMQYLSQHYHVCPLEDVANALLNGTQLDQNTAVITFDDGYHDFYSHAYPILQKYDLPATVFITTGYVNTLQPFEWDELEFLLLSTNQNHVSLDDASQNHQEIPTSTLPQRLEAISTISAILSQLPHNRKTKVLANLRDQIDVIQPEYAITPALTWDEIIEMSEHNIHFGAHTVTHPILTAIPISEAKSEILESKHELERHLNQAVTAFAYPTGREEDFNPEIIAILKDAGFLCSVTAIPGTVSTSSDRYAMKRLGSGRSFTDMKFILSGLYLPLKTRFFQ